MNQRIEKYRAIEYVILSFIVCAMLLIGPFGILNRDRVMKGNELQAGETAASDTENTLQQVFIADGSYLKNIELLALDDISGRVISLVVYDDQNETLFSGKVAVEKYQAPGFIRLPVEIETVPGRAYVWVIKGPAEGVRLAYQDTAQSGLSTMGNYYYNGQEQLAKSVVMRATYREDLSAGKLAALLAVLVVLCAALVLGVEQLHKRDRLLGEVSVHWIVRCVFNPILAAGTAAALLAVYYFDWYGGVRSDKAVYTAGILIAAALLFYVVNAKRKGTEPLFIWDQVEVPDRLMDWLQTLFFAGAIWGCIDYMNAMYNIYQAYAYRKVLIFLGLVLLTMCRKKYVFHWGNLVWLVLSGIGGYLYYRPFIGVEEQDLLVRYDCYLVMVAGLVAIQLVLLFVKKQIPWKELSIPYAILLAFFLGMLVVFRNTRGWPIYLAAAFGLFYLFYVSWEQKERLLSNFCNGIILNFAVALIFAFLRRPLRAWFFYRYNFVFHTVTVTAYYLTLVVSALLVKLLMEYKKSRRLLDYWKTALLFGIAFSLLIMTFSRTGYLAAAVMIAIIYLFASFVCYRDKITVFLGKTAVFFGICLACFPLTYSAVRLIPPLYDDPYIFELEESEWAVHKGDRADSSNYITFARFAYCMDEKLFGEDCFIMRKFVDTFLASDETRTPQNKEVRLSACVEREGGLVASLNSIAPPPPVLLSAQAGAPDEEEGEDVSNGRIDIFRRYMAEWNLTGHDDMGVALEDGSMSVHAHNTYLQVIHDHGLLTGAVFLLIGVCSVVMMFVYGKQKQDSEPYALMPLAVFLSFAAAGLVEWLFHPCNPLGFAMLIVLAPLLVYKGKGLSAGKSSKAAREAV